MYGCQQVLLNPDKELAAVLEFICTEANNLMNCGIYYARQIWFKRRRIIGKYDLEKEYKNNRHFQALYSQAAQQALRTVSESFKSFGGLMKAFRKGKITDNPRLPKYLKKGGLSAVSYPKQALKIKDGHILRKVEIQLGLDLAKVCRAFLTAPSRVFLWNSKKTKGRDAASACPVVSS